MGEVSEATALHTREAGGAWLVSEDSTGLWSAMVKLDGEWIPLGYFGARQDAEETIAACLQPSRPLDARADGAAMMVPPA